MEHEEWHPGSFLGRLKPESLDRIITLGRAVQFTEGDRLILEGDGGTDVFILLTGIVKVSAITIRGQSVLLALRLGGDIVGEMAAVDGRPRTATVMACGAVSARVISAQVWRQYLRSSDEGFTAIYGVTNDRLRVETRKRIDFAGHTANGRVAMVLSEFVRTHGNPTDHGIEIAFSLTQEELAAAAECALTSVQAFLKELRESAILGTRYRRIVIFDETRLQAHCNP
ncbi:Crp/Fnr family transcriptional regulator [Kineosporia mesophila]|uniref:Crp/Fnr family transcriptional regulator n=1 Tax=Kineosporia mesophila TaxID=566012 RepID=A0ABP7A1B7_9ACTN|nr:Crp/Fnr family transcriptional regulator [Kineosporia mesophila]MCD5353248.1 Crp/Fnr family transcriptional regulator [Kineosporia mesophila]